MPACLIFVVLFAVLPDAVREGERGHADADATANAVDEMTLVVVEADEFLAAFET